MKHAILLLTFCSAGLSSDYTLAAAKNHSDHEGMGHDMSQEMPDTKPATDPHAEHQRPSSAKSYAIVPEPTDAERAVAFPDLGGMDLRKMMDTPIMFYALLDQFEWVNADEGSALSWAGLGWLGNDNERLWVRTKGTRAEGETENAELQLLYGQPFARWWDWVAGVRHDFKPGPAQTWLGAGVQGLAPYWFESEATLYLGEAGQTNLRLEVEYELLITQRIVLQPLMEMNIFGKNDEQRGIGSGLAHTELGLRLRYEIRRELAPYIGLSWERSYGETADLAQADGEAIKNTALVAGIRLWY